MTFHRCAFTPGARIVRVEVLSRSMDVADDSGGMLELRCDCGYEFRITTQQARMVAQRQSLACRLCRTAEPGEPCLSRRGLSKACSYCKRPGHSRRDCPQKPSSKPERHCARCADLEHRRDIPRCLRCGELYKPLPPVSLAEILERPRDDRTVLPTGGGFR
jgi:hypothetical protein